MKTFGFVLLFMAGTAFSQSVMKDWEPILQQKEVATYFAGMWESLGVNIKETGEEVTILHLGDHFEMNEGVNPEKVDYNIFLKLKNVSNMAGHGEDGVIDQKESFQIMKVLFTPFVRSSLKHPMMNKKFQMKIAGIENHVHVYLNGPNKEQATHTMIFINDQWMVIEGIHGEAKRVFEITVDQAIEYQREAFKAQKGDTRKSWKAFKKFYLKWRKEVSHEID